MPSGSLNSFVEQRNATFHILSISVIIFVPWSVFVATLTACAFHYGHIVLAFFVILSCAFVCLLFFLMHGRNRRGPIYLYVSVLCAFAMIGGARIGISVAQSYISPYDISSDRAAYHEVSPAAAAAEYADAGVISFNQFAFVDRRRSFSQKIKDWNRYCVAPIVTDASMERADFWAVGTNCCDGWRFTCGDVVNEAVKSGIAVGGSDRPFAPPEYERFQDAAKQAASMFHMITPEEPVFVKWVHDPDTLLHSMWSDGMFVLIVATLSSLVVFAIVGALLHELSGRREKARRRELTPREPTVNGRDRKSVV